MERLFWLDTDNVRDTLPSLVGEWPGFFLAPEEEEEDEEDFMVVPPLPLLAPPLFLLFQRSDVCLFRPSYGCVCIFCCCSKGWWWATSVVAFWVPPQ